MPECAIQTSEGVKVADVAWISAKRFDLILEETTASIAPEICIEVKSESNTNEEMELKKNLYLSAQAKEVWFCDPYGNMRFFNEEKELEISLLVPNFPKQIKRRHQQ
jgi:Uma2 family endonuclease